MSMDAEQRTTSERGARENDALPRGWVWTTISEITQPIEKVDPTAELDREFTYLDISSIDNQTNRVFEPKKYSGLDAPSRARQLIRSYDTLFSTVRIYLRNVAMVPEAYDGQIASTGFAVLRPKDGILPQYVFYYCLTEDFIKRLNALQRGTNYPAVRDRDVREQPIPLAPLPEQQRIVAEIEKQFTRLDAGVAALRRAQAALKRYKAAVLKAACEGRLVPQDPNDEPADVLLQRILAERRVKWEADLRAKNKDPKKAKYAEPAAPNTSTLPALPRGWVWATMQQVSWAAGYGTSQKCDYEDTGAPVLRIPNIANGGFDFSDIKYATIPDELDEEDALVADDLLIIRTNGSKDLIGRCGLVRKSFDTHFYFASYLIRFRIVNDGVAVWLATTWDSSFNRQHIEKIAATSAGQYNVSVASLNRICFPLPPLADQQRIVAEVEQRLSVVQELEATVAANLARAERLRQAILQRAFAGKLVPQDPNDEPASVLLERIRREREDKEPQQLSLLSTRKNKRSRPRHRKSAQ